ncbi:thymidylate kinase [Plakobranchus ocellatus]|uniref:Thymidylate kinase n=1 Tax=Plakobranchus ocellatus TaxID=259542 RepID=A0AAV4BVF9_9GAST|nr:thymidylate kinase [Plakobranchus ocellatus]
MCANFHFATISEVFKLSTRSRSTRIWGTLKLFRVSDIASYSSTMMQAMTYGKTSSRGKLIVFEGCDRSGKSTQCAMLTERLRKDGHKVEQLKFPDRTTSIGHMINNYLANKEEQRDEVIHLLFSANRWESMQKMSNLLLGGTTLVVDRYAYSGIAYSAAKGMDLQWCRQPDVGLIKPDKVIFMTLSADRASERAAFGEERYEKKEFQAKVEKIFEQLFEKSYWQNVSGDGTVEEVHNDVYGVVSQIVSSDCGPLEKLWTEGTIHHNAAH